MKRAVVFGLVLLASCARAPAPAPVSASAETPAESWSAFTDRFIEARMQADPYFAVQAGRHEFDGRMPDWSREAIMADTAQLRRFRDELAMFVSAAPGSTENFERERLAWVMDSAIFWNEKAQAPFRNPAWYLDRLDPSPYLTREYAPLPDRLRGFLGYLRALPVLTANIRENLRTPLPAPFVERGADGFGGYASFLRDETPSIVGQLDDVALRAELLQAAKVAAAAMDELKVWIESQRTRATDDFALGPALFSEMLRATERVDIPLEELELVGRRDLERNLAALREACAQFAPRATLATCVERMRSNKPRGGSVAGARVQLSQLRQFVLDHDIVSIPSEEQALVAESPPYNRGNFAYISIPGPYEDAAVKSTYYVTPPDAKWSATERNAYLPGAAYLLYVSAHEVWPGHYLQSQFANANPARAAALWWGYSFGEGWAHYAEEMMYDAGLGAGSPEMRVGMLTNALLRDVRFISAICLHSGCMTLAESEAMFREVAFADAGNARQQALRGAYDPGYLAYTLGKLMIRKLRVDWLAANPGASAKQFHDRLLSFGVPPLPLVREHMLGSAGGAL